VARFLTTTEPQAGQSGAFESPNRPPVVWGTSEDGNLSPWDFVIRSVADLAPFDIGGNIFQLPSGSYAFAGPVNLGVAQILVPLASTVLVKGFGVDKVVTGANAAATWNVAGNARFESLATTVSAGVCVLASAPSGVVRSSQCVWTASGAARCLDVSGAATAFDSQSQYNAVVGPVLLTGTGGRLSLDQCRLAFTGSNGIGCLGSGSRVSLVDTDIDGRIPIRSTDATLDFQAFGGLFNGTGGATPLSISNAGRFVLHGTHVAGVDSSLAAMDLFKALGAHFSGGGLVVDGGITALVLDGTTAENMTTFLRWSSGAVSTAQVVACETAGNVTNGIDWAAANIPSRGLLVVGTSFGSAAANAFVNFTESDARVNVKACSAAGALLTETAIVP